MAKIVPSDISIEFRGKGSTDCTVDDDAIKDFWAYHFPRRKENAGSKAALIGLIRLMSERSISSAEPESTADVAHHFGIPLAEFYEYEQEER